MQKLSPPYHTNIDLHPINFFKYQIYPRICLKGRRCRGRFSVVGDLGCIAVLVVAILFRIVEELVTLSRQHRWCRWCAGVFLLRFWKNGGWAFPEIEFQNCDSVIGFQNCDSVIGFRNYDSVIENIECGLSYEKKIS